jgi:ubiquinone/menaquinone biosynthesis C-methylase UbiE
MARISPESLLRFIIPSRLRLWINGTFYNFLSRRASEHNIRFLNFGYCPATVPEQDDFSRPKAQLYEEVVSAVSIKGSSVLEISSGLGGGAIHLTEQHQPKSYHALDLSSVAIDFCQKNNSNPDMTFVQGNAESLPFKEEQFDVIINVEAAMNYTSLQAFVAEVKRVLRPGGYFLIADQVSDSEVKKLSDTLTPEGMNLISSRDITGNVLMAIDTLNDMTLENIRQIIPRPLQWFVKQFAALRDTAVYRRFQSRKFQYIIYCIQKSHEN